MGNCAVLGRDEKSKMELCSARPGRRSQAVGDIIPAMKRDAGIHMAIRTSDRPYYEQAGERHDLDFGVAYCNPRHPSLPGCNFVDEVLIEDVADGTAAAAQIEQFFAERSLKCLRWIPAIGQDPAELEPLLAPKGFVRQDRVALAVPPAVSGGKDDQVRVLAARAMRRTTREILGERYRDHGDQADALVELHMSRMDAPEYDGFVALLDERPAGFVALHQVGEIGRVRDLYVTGEMRRRGVASAMLNSLIATARRWALRPICGAVPCDDQPARALCAKVGFEEVGVLAEFHARGAAADRE